MNEIDEFINARRLISNKGKKFLLEYPFLELSLRPLELNDVNWDLCLMTDNAFRIDFK